MNNDRFIESIRKQRSTLPTERKTSNAKCRERNSRSRKTENSKIRRKIQKFRRNLDQSLSLSFRSWWGRLNLIGGVDAALEEESGNGWRYIAVASSSTFNFLINQSSDGRERLSLSVENGRPQIWSITKIFPPPPIVFNVPDVGYATYAYLVALFCSNRRKFNYMILAFHEDTFCDNVQSVEKRGMKFRRPWSDRNLCCQGNNRNRSFQKVGNIEDIFLIFFLSLSLSVSSFDAALWEAATLWRENIKYNEYDMTRRRGSMD